MKQEEVQAQGELHGSGGLGAEGAVDGVEDALDGGGVEGRGGGDAAAVGEGEGGGEGFDGAGMRSRPAPRSSMKSSGAGTAMMRRPPGCRTRRNSGAFMRAVMERMRENERIGVREEAIGIGYDPFAFGVAARGGIDGGDRNIDAVGAEAGLAGEGSEVEAVAAAGVKRGVGRRWGDGPGDGVQEGGGGAAFVEAAACGKGGGGVAGSVGAAVLGLEEIDVAAAGDVEGMPAGAVEAAVLTHQCHAAIANGAEEHGSSVANGGLDSGWRRE